MKNVLRVWKRDVLRLFKAPAALVVVVVLVVLPSLYTWFNVIGFWNPYDNTGNLRVCVVNEDEGATTDLTGDLDVGAQIVEEIQSNTQLGWTFTDRETAMDEVKSGEAYAAFIIPEDFSYNLTTLLTGDFVQPKLEYYVNEKAGAVSPKITDTGANTLDQTVNSTFVSTVSSVVADMIDKELTASKNDIDASQSSVAAQFAKAKAALSEARTAVEGLTSATDQAACDASGAQTTLVEAKSDIALLSEQLQQMSELIVSTQNALGAFNASMMNVLDKSSVLAATAAARTDSSIGATAASIVAAQVDINAAIKNGQDNVATNTLIIQKLSDLQENLPDDSPYKKTIGLIVDDLTAQNANLETTLENLTRLSAETTAAANSIAAASDATNTAIQGTLESTDAYRKTLSDSTLPQINRSLTQLANTASGLSTAVASQSLLIDQTSLELSQLTSTLAATSSALTQTDALLADLDSVIDGVQTDLISLETSSALSEILDGTTIDASKIADFMLSPTELQTESLYSLNAYGSAMAPLFTNLTLWIGAFMLMVILKQGVDSEGIKKLTIAQRYWGRWLFLAPLAALQAVVCCAGNLFIGVQTVNAPLFFLTAIVASLTYLSIQFMLSVTLQHIGKGICVVLVFVQIPGATGLYPIEMTPDFFQAIYPFFPFTYGINAMRETIAGFYDGQWVQLMAMLLLFLVVSFVVGLLVRPYLTNLNRMFAKQIQASDILNGEEVYVPQRRYRLAQLVSALSDREEYRERLREHAKRFIRWYPHLKHSAWFFGVAVPLFATVGLSLTGSEKVIMLTAWLVWLVLIIMFLVVIEHIRDSFERQSLLEALNDDELSALFLARTSLDDDTPAAEGSASAKSPVPAEETAPSSAPAEDPEPVSVSADSLPPETAPAAKAPQEGRDA